MYGMCVCLWPSHQHQNLCVYMYLYLCVCPSHQSRYFSLNEKELEVVATYTVAPTTKQALEHVGLHNEKYENIPMMVSIHV